MAGTATCADVSVHLVSFPGPKAQTWDETSEHSSHSCVELSGSFAFISSVEVHMCMRRYANMVQQIYHIHSAHAAI